ncbi:hypothetical protein C3L33_22613, partial [Rhododendron williamsianum]
MLLVLEPYCFVADHLVEADPTFDDSIQDVLCRCFSICSPWVSCLWRKVISIIWWAISSCRADIALTDNRSLRLFLMLQRFPVESKGRRKKLQEAYVGYVTTICFTCFLVRGIMMCFNAFDKAADLDVLDHPVLNFIYYLPFEESESSLYLQENVVFAAAFFTVGGDTAFFSCALHFEEVAPKARDHTISPYSLTVLLINVISISRLEIVVELVLGSFAANLAVPRKGSAKCFRNHSAYLEVISIDKCEMNGDE